MKLLALVLSLLVLTLVHEGESSSLETERCDFTCQGSEYFDYQEGRSYFYSYQAVVQNSFHDNAGSQQQSEVTINANIVIDIISQCKHNLRITSASLVNADQPRLDIASWEEALIRNPLSFTREDGAVKSLCASNDDPVWVMNIKRGILSSLSVSSVDTNASPTVVESDILGICTTTEYVITSNRGNKEITKEKDLSTCVNSNRPFGSFFTTLSAGAGNAIKQNQRCTQSVTMNGLTRSECTEEHILRPFSSEDDGAMTKITQILSLQSDGSSGYYLSSVAENDGRQTTLSFEDEIPQGSQQNIDEVLNLYSKICRTMDTETFEEVSQDYVKMIFLLRRLDSSAIAQAYSSLNGACPAWESSLRSMFMDALKWCGSEGCVTYGAQLIATGSELFDEAASLQWLAAMSLIKEPTLPMIEAMIDILQSGRFSEQAYLTTGSLVHGVCSNDDNCFRHYAVRNALRFFEDQLGTDCYNPSVEAQNSILLAMKALGNAGRITDSAVIAACAKQNNNAGEIRVAALQAFRRMPCGIDRAVDSLVFDRAEDSEIRINAYLTLMKCPTSTFLSKITAMLDDEPSQQMASFVSTHLRALVASSDPLKVYIKPYLIEAEFAKTYDMDPRKFSRYFETSYYSDHLNAGGTVEGSLIWSPRSFVPRSANLNLTANVFGQSINLLELGGRVEGVEKLLQDVMQTKQFLQDTGIGNIFGQDDFFENEEEDFDEPVNARKSKKAKKIPNIGKMKELNKQYENTMHQESLGASYFVRLFGNEISYGNSHPREVKKDIANQISSFFDAVAQGQELSYHKNVAFATWAYTLPTGVGLPLTVAVNGSASLDVRVNGQMDFSNLLSANPEFAVNTEINPRSTIVINGAMTVDAHVTEAGIMTESSMKSGWRLSGRASLTNGQRIKVRVDAPYQEHSLFRFNHKLMKVAGEQRVPMTPEGSVPSSSECSSEFAGHSLCFTKPVGDVSIFPESGSLTYALTIEKRDRDLSHFIFTADYALEQDGSSIPVTASANIVFDTPGSQINRHSELNLEFARDELRAEASLQQPSGSSRVSGRITSAGNSMSVSATYSSNGNENQFQGTFVNGLGDEVPNFSIDASLARPGRGDTLTFTTSASYSSMQMISIQSSLTDVFDIRLGFEDVSAKGKLIYDGNALVTLPFYENGVDFTVTIKPRYDNFAASAVYTLRGQSQESIRIVHKHRDTSTAVSTSWSSEEKLLISEYSDYNLVAALSYSNDPNTLESTAKISYGPEAGNDPCRKCILVNQRYSIEGSTDENTNVEGSLDINIPYVSIEESVGFTVVYGPSRVQVNLQFKGEDQFRFNAANNGANNKEIEVLTPTPWGSVTLSGTLEETRPSVYELNGGFNFGHSSDFEMRTAVIVSNQVDQKMISITVEGTERILMLRSDNRYLQPAGFSSENYFETQYYSPITLTVRHEGQEEGGFETAFHFDYNPHLLGFSINVNPESKNANANVYYNNNGERQEMIAQIEYSNTPRQPGETYYSASARLQTNIRKLPFNRAVMSGAYSQLNDVVSVSGDVEVENRKLIDFSVRSTFGEQFSLNADVAQTIASTMQRVIANLEVNIEEKRGSLSVSNGRQDLINANLEIGTTSATVTIQQTITNLAPDRVDASFEVSDGRVTLNANLDGNTFSLTGVMPNESKLVVSLQQSLPNLLRFSVPRSMNLETQWGVRRSDGKMGLWSTLTVDRGQECVFEVLYGNRGTVHTVELNFNPNEVEVIRRVASSLTMAGELRLPTNNDIHFQYSLFYGGVESESASLDYISDSFNMEYHQSIFPCKFIPSDIVAFANWGDVNDAGVTVTVLDAETSLSGKAIVKSSPYVFADIELGFTSNHPMVAGNYRAAFSFDESENNLAKFSVSANDHVASCSLTWSLQARTMAFNAAQNFYSDRELPYLPYNIRLSLAGTEAMRSTQLEMIYNDKYIYYDHEYEMEDFDAEYDARVRQNISPLANDVKLSLSYATTTQQVGNIFGIVIKGSAAIDGEEEQKVEFGFKRDYEEPTRTYTVTFSQEASAFDHIWFAPEDVTITLSYGGSACGLNIVKRGNSPVTVVVDADWSDAFVIRHSVVNDGIARLSGWDMFRYETEVNIESNRVSVTGQFQNQNEQNFDASAVVGWSETESGYEINTDFRSNVFDVLDLNLPFEIPNQVQTHSILSYEFSTRLEVNLSKNTTITRSFANGNLLVNTIHLNGVVDVFTKSVSFKVTHDFEDIPIPKLLGFACQGHFNRDATTSDVFLSASGSVTVNDLIQGASMSLTYRPTISSLLLISSQNVTQVLQYGIPRTMSINFNGRSWSDFVLTIVYDTNRKSVGFNFDYISDDKKLVTYIYHNFDAVENMGWPKKIGAEFQVRIDEKDGTLNVMTVFGNDVRVGSSSYRYGGDSFQTSHEFSYRYTQNFTDLLYVPNKVKGSLSINEDNFGFDARLNLDSREVRAKVNYENMGIEKSLGVSFYQTFTRNYPKRYQVASTVNTEDSSLEFKLKLDGRTKFTLSGHFEMNEDTGRFQSRGEMDHKFDIPIPDHIDMAIEGSYTEQGLAINLDLTQNEDPTNSYSLSTGGDASAFFAEFQHNMIGSSMPAEARVDGSLLRNPGSVDLDLRLSRGQSENAVTLSSSWQLSRTSVFGAASVSHDFEELSHVPRYLGVKSFLSSDDQQMIADLNVTINDELFQHLVSVSCLSGTNQFKYGVDMSHKNSYLSDMGVPEAAGATLQAQYGNKQLTSQMSVTYVSPQISLRSSLSLNGDCSRNDYSVRYLNSFSSSDSSREDQLGLRLNLNKYNPMIQVRLQTPELTSLGIPSDYTLQLIGNEETFDWTARGEADGEIIQIRAQMRNAKVPNFDLFSSLSAFQNQRYLSQILKVPRNMSVELEARNNAADYNGRVTARYDNHYVEVGSNYQTSDMGGELTNYMNTNIAELGSVQSRTWRTNYSFDGSRNVFTTNGAYDEDSSTVADYDFSLDLNSNEVAFTCQHLGIIDLRIAVDSSAFVNSISSEMLPLSIGMTKDNVDYLMQLLVRPTNNWNGKEYEWKYNGGEVNFDTVLSVSDSNFISLSLASSGCDYLPESMSLSYSEPLDVRASWMHRAVQNFNLRVDNERMEMTVNDLNGQLLASIDGTHNSAAMISDGTVRIPYLDINHRLTSHLQFLGKTGNSTAVITLHELSTGNVATVTCFAFLQGRRWGDIFAAATLDSSIESIPYNVRVTANSTVDQATRVLYYTLKAAGLGEDVVVQVIHGNEKTEIAVHVGPSRYGLASQSSRGHTSVVKSTSIQWGRPNDRIDLSVEYSSMNLKNILTIAIEQPSNAFGFYHFDVTGSIDLSSSLSVKVSGNLDSNTAEAVASYEGAYPKFYGSHDVVFQLAWTYPTGTMQTQSASVKVVIDNSVFNTEISVQSNSQTLLSFSKKVSMGNDGYNVMVTMKQSLVSSVGLNYFSFAHSARYTSDRVSSEGSLQLNDMPETRYSGSYTKLVDNSNFNYSLAFDVSTGALSKWILFRTLAARGWQQQKNMIPSFSYTVVVDSKEYHVSTENAVTRSSRTERTNTEVILRHPHTIQLLGVTLPKRNTFSMDFLNRRKGMRVVAEYMNEMLGYPIKVETNIRFNNGDRVVEGGVQISHSKNDEQDTDANFFLSRDPSGYTISLDFENPPVVPSFKLVASLIDSQEELAVDLNFSDKAEGQTYHLRVGIAQGIITIVLELPGQDAINLRGDIPAIVNQASAIIKRLLSEGGESGLNFVKGIDETETGFDMYIGLGNLFGNTYTLHLVVENNSPTAGISINVQENGVKSADVVSVSVSLVSGRLVKLHMRANTVLSSVIKNVVGIVESELNNKVDWLSDHIVQLLNTLSSAVSGSQQVTSEVEAAIRYLVDQVKRTRDSGVQLVSEVSRSVTNMVEYGEQDLQNIVRGQIVYLLEKVKSLNSMLLQPIQTIIEKYETDLVKTIQSTVTHQLELPRAALDIINAGDLFINLVEEAIEKGISQCYVKVDSFILAIRGPVRDLVTVTNDEVIITIPLAFSLEGFSLDDLPTLEESKGWFKQTALSQQLDNTIQIAYSYLDTFYILQAFYYTPLEEQIPPFKGHAFIADFKHYRTFDGRYYDFVSSCESSHVVATDGKNGNFTITLTYGENPTYGVRVGTDLITISDDGSVTHNQNNVNLPVTSSSGLVALRVGNSIKIRHGDDLALSYDTTTNLLIVNISPFYFASTGGLLGMFDNEPNFDFVTPTGEQVDDVTQFAYAWEISDVKCSHENAYETSIDNRAQSACESLYKSSNSQFRPCYPIVPSEDFYTACMKTKDDFCKVAKAYQTTCALKGALVSPPNECLSCAATSGGDLQGGAEESYDVSSVDIVIIIQENECLNKRGKTVAKFLKKFTKTIVSTFNSMGKARTNFFMVGYGGPGSLKEAHTYTIKGGKISTARKSDIAKRIRHVSLSRTGAAHDGMAAIEFASKLPFRAGAQQIFLHVMCDSCTPQSAVSPSAVSSMLASRNIVYHYLPLNKIATRERNNKQIYGYDNNRSYIKKSRNVNLNQIQQDESDICIPVATSSGGAVWDGNLVKLSDFVNVFTHHMATNLPAVGRQTCTCQLDEYGEVASKCVY